MWYLWLQILFLLALAALAGAGLAYWWLRGRYEDVTESYSSLVSGADGEVAPDLMGRSDLEARLNHLAAKIDQIENTDLSPLESQLLSLSNEIPNAAPELSPIISELQTVGEDVRRSEAYSHSIDERLAAIEAGLHRPDEGGAALAALTQRLEALETGLSDRFNTSIGHLHNAMNDKAEFDLGPVLARLAELKGQVDQLGALPPQLAQLAKQNNDLAEQQALSVKSEVSRLEQRFNVLSDGMLQPIQNELQSMVAKSPTAETLTQRLDTRLRAIEDQITHSQQSLRPLHDKLDDLIPVAAANAGNQRTLTAMDQKLVAFDDSIIGIKQRMDQIGAILTALDQRVDTASLQSRLEQTATEVAALRGALPGQMAFEPLEQALSRLQQMVFNLRERDLAGLNGAIRSIENRVDFVGVENRLTSIEYGLAATHHMLRSRLEQAAELPPAPQREPFREAPKDFAFAPPSSFRTPEAALDPVDMIRNTESAGNLLLEPGFGQADNLEKIRGIGPMLRQLLNDTGVFYYWQIAEWTDEDVASVDALLPGYQGRITRDRWVEQAQELAVLTGSANRPQPFGEES
ncbi:MAG: hypothetical protein AAFO74_17105 [Pseudomonadota bacterium]